MPHRSSRTARSLHFRLLSMAVLLASCAATPVSQPREGARDAALTVQARPTDNPLSIAGVSASSSNRAESPAAKAVDGDLDTWWGANGKGAWIRFDLGSVRSVDAVSLAWYRGRQRKATFDVEVSRDGSSWSKILSGATSSGKSSNLERYNLPDTDARFVRIVNGGNTENTAIGITEAVVNGSDGGGSGGGGDGGNDGPGGATASGRKYYVDCASGSDRNGGTSTDSAWRSLGKVNGARLNPGDGVFLKRGCTFQGPLNARWSGTSSARIVVDAYGSGDLPKVYGGQPGAVAITGKYITVQNLQVTADKPAPYKHAEKCKNTPMGWRIGFAFMSGASNNIVQNSRAYGLTGGVHLASGARYNKVLRNTLINNTTMSSNTKDPNLDNSGAWGVLINGDDNEIAYNYTSGNTACSEKYTVEGASYEVYKAKRNYFHHNTSINDTTFTEMGGNPDDRAENNVYAYNLFAPLNTPYATGEMLVIRGWNSRWGANPGTKFYNNTAFNVNVGIYCGEGCDRSILSARNNIIVSRADATKAALWADGDIDEGNNIYWRNGGGYTSVYKPGGVGSSSRVTDPRFSNAWGRDFSLQSGSPAVNAGVVWPLRDLGITTDLNGNNNLVGGIPDLGPIERQ